MSKTTHKLINSKRKLSARTFVFDLCLGNGNSTDSSSYLVLCARNNFVRRLMISFLLLMCVGVCTSSGWTFRRGGAVKGFVQYLVSPTRGERLLDPICPASGWLSTARDSNRLYHSHSVPKTWKLRQRSHKIRSFKAEQRKTKENSIKMSGM